MNIEQYIDMVFSSYEIFLTLALSAVACSVIGVFLVLRKLSMVSDAISHTVLLGIVLAFFITKDITSPLLVVGAAVFGVVTVFAIESLSNTGLVKNDDSVGIIFPLFFALAVILISRYARNVHLDTDIVLMGEVIMTPLNRMDILGASVPVSIVQMGIMLVINILFVIIFFKELKITSFDEEFATIMGFSSGILFYALMSLASMTAVTAFETVGAILVVSFLITPAASAYLVTKNLKAMIVVSALYAIVNSLIGYLAGLFLNLSISGATATSAGLTFMITLLFNRDGVITQALSRKKARKELKYISVILHIGNHQNTQRESVELGINTMYEHLNWDKNEVKSIVGNLIHKNLINLDKSKQIYKLSEKGLHLYAQVKKEYGLKR